MKITASSVNLLTEEAQQLILKQIIGGLTHFAKEDPAYVLEVLILGLDEADNDDGFGTEGSRHTFGLED